MRQERMNIERTNLKYICVIGILLFLFASPASADPDAILDRSRTQFADIDANTINYIHARFDEVDQDLLLIPDITSLTDYVSGSSSDSAFVANINALDDTTNVNVVVIHTHGGTNETLSASYLQFKDSSWLSDSNVNNWMDGRNGGFMFAGACKSAKYTDLGNEFIDKGFDTYFGYQDTVLAKRNARFYAAFFDLATFTNVKVSEAARYAEDEVEDEFGSADDVGNNRFIGNSDLCLRT